MSENNPWGFVPAQSNPSFVSERFEQDISKVQGGFSALFGEPAVDWAGVDVVEQSVVRRSPRKKRG